MRKIPWVTILVSVVLGFVAGLIAHDYRTGIVLGTDDQHVSYSHKFSANGKYLASEATPTKGNDFHVELKLFDLETGQRVAQFPHAVQTIWCCANDGSILTVGESPQYTKDSQGKEVHVHRYGFYRRELSSEKNTEICYWTMTDLPMIGLPLIPPSDQLHSVVMEPSSLMADMKMVKCGSTSSIPRLANRKIRFQSITLLSWYD